MRASFSLVLKSCLLLGCLSTCYAQNNNNNNLEDLKYVSAFAKAIQFVEANQDKVWPGFHLTQYPIILNFMKYDSTPTYALQFSPKSPEWKRLEIENMIVYYQADKNFDTQYIIDFMMVEGQNSLIKKIPPGDDFINDELNELVHYLFRDYQIRNSQFSREALDYPAYTYDGYNQISNVAFIAIERASLKDYLSNHDTESLKNYLAIHQTRLSQLNADSVRYENALELSAGTQRYAAIKSLNLSDESYAKEALSYYPGYDCG